MGRWDSFKINFTGNTGVIAPIELNRTRDIFIPACPLMGSREAQRLTIPLLARG